MTRNIDLDVEVRVKILEWKDFLEIFSCVA